MKVASYFRYTVTFGCLVLLISFTWSKAPKVFGVLSSWIYTWNGIHSSFKSMVLFEDTKKYDSRGDESHHVAFLKVHKTGSSSVQNIFLRFGQSRNLTFILAHDKIGLAESSLPNMISYHNSLTDKNIVPPPEGRHYEVLCCHVIYNRTQFEKYLPKDTKYIGIVRDPITRLESAIKFFGLFTNMNLSTYANNPLRFEKAPASLSNNRMAFEFGYPLPLFPNSHEQPDDVKGTIEEYTTKLFKEFDLILINERIDESLVLMKRILNWHVKDILYMKHLVAKEEPRRFTDTDKRSLKSFLHLDFFLYQHALDVFSVKLKSLGIDFQEEVASYKKDKAKVTEFCETSVNSILEFDGTKWSSAYNVTRENCKLFTFYEIDYIQAIRLQQYGRLNI